MTTRDTAIAYLHAEISAKATARAAEDAALVAAHQQAIAALEAQQAAEVQTLVVKRQAEDQTALDIVNLLSAYVPADAVINPAPVDPTTAAA